MKTQTNLMLVEEFSDKELEAISGGARPTKQSGLVNVNVQDVSVDVAAVVLSRAVAISQND